MKKGVLKGLKYISQIFDEEQEQEIQIGLPTDVKHVAHIGNDGPSTESPSWLKDYKGPERPVSAPLDNNGEPLDSSNQNDRDMPNSPKSSRRTQSADNLSIEREISTKSKGSGRRHRRKESNEDSHHKSRRRHHRKDSSSSDREGSNRSSGGGNSQELSGPESPSSPTSKKVPHIPKSSRRKKSKDDSGSTKSSKSKDAVPATSSTTYTCPFSEAAGQGVSNDHTTMSCNSESCQTS